MSADDSQFDRDLIAENYAEEDRARDSMVCPLSGQVCHCGTADTRCEEQAAAWASHGRREP